MRFADWSRPADVRLVRSLAERITHPARRVPRRRSAGMVTAVFVCGAALAVVGAMVRAALTGPLGFVFWLVVLLAFLLGAKWRRAEDRRLARFVDERQMDAIKQRYREVSRAHIVAFEPDEGQGGLYVSPSAPFARGRV
jgi:cobalamin biosynthesis protein CobD/CbiB